MFKSFTLALLPCIALARGDNDGSNRDNAYEMALFTSDFGNLTLYTYNANSAEDGSGTDEFHGDLALTDVGAGAFMTEFLQMGFCFKPVDAPEGWDCMQVKTNIKPSTLGDTADPLGTASQSYTVYDGKLLNADIAAFNGTPFFDADFATTTDASINWKLIASKSFKTNCVELDGNAAKVGCDAVNAHWYRNWVTSEDQEDIQLADEMAGTEFSVWGWVAGNTGSNEPSGNQYRWNKGAIVTTQTVFAAYITNRDELIAAAAAGDGDGDGDGDGGDGGDGGNTDNTDDDDDGSNDDGASTVTTYAAALFATIYALAF